MNGIGGLCNASTSGSVVVAEDPGAVFGVGERWVHIHGYGYVCIGGANWLHCHPRTLFSAANGSISAVGSTVNVNSLAETGVVGGDAATRFGKAVDPDDANKRALLHAIRPADTPINGGVRSEHAFGGTSERLTFGERFWIGFSVRIAEDWKDGAASGVGNTATGADEVMIWQWHCNPDVGDSEVNPPISLIAMSGGGSLSACRQKLVIKYNVNATTLTADTVTRTGFDETNPPFGMWQHFAIDAVSHWDATQSPHFRLYRAIEDGDVVQLIDDALPNHYNNTNAGYLKHGMYYYASTNAWSNSRTEWAMHSKGMHVWRHSDDLSAQGVVDYLRAI